MTALPSDSQQEDPLDSQRILRGLPDRKHETFLAQYGRLWTVHTTPLAASI